MAKPFGRETRITAEDAEDRGGDGIASGQPALDAIAENAIPPPAGLSRSDLPPLVVSGLVVAKADLLAVLRLWSPQIVDLAALDDGRFLLSVDQRHDHRPGSLVDRNGAEP